MSDADSGYLNLPTRSVREAEQQRVIDSLNYQLGVALGTLRSISRSCPHPEWQDAATAALTKIAKAGADR